MFSKFDKAWVAFLTPALVFLAEAILDPEKSPAAVVTDLDTWIMAVATAVLVYAVPNRGTVYLDDGEAQ